MVEDMKTQNLAASDEIAEIIKEYGEKLKPYGISINYCKVKDLDSSFNVMVDDESLFLKVLNNLIESIKEVAKTDTSLKYIYGSMLRVKYILHEEPRDIERLVTLTRIMDYDTAKVIFKAAIDRIPINFKD